MNLLPVFVTSATMLPCCSKVFNNTRGSDFHLYKVTSAAAASTSGLKAALRDPYEVAHCIARNVQRAEVLLVFPPLVLWYLQKHCFLLLDQVSDQATPFVATCLGNQKALPLATVKK